MIPLIISGPTSNRVDLVFFSDGYLEEEKQKFINDALRLAEDVSRNQTFNTVQPLLNFWAGFSASEESGVGTHGKPRKTPFGLYRDGTELRGVYYAHPEVGKAACDSLGDQCDYPILLGNDPLYGGLGGDFTVITASILNGPLVLRHELGHSILDVGEEYDGGFAYFGRNAAHDPRNITWTQWLSNSSRVDEDGVPLVEKSNMAMQAYPWTLLDIKEPWSIRFSSPGTYSRYKLQFSLSGIPSKGDLRVTLDGVDLGWTPRRHIGMDRWFYNFHSDESLAPGNHELKFTLLNKKHQGSAQLCSTEILEYGDESEFILKPGFYGLYPTYSDKNETSYRPTNEDCLMRAVATPNFCKACIETLWLKLLRNITFIDGIQESCEKGLLAGSSEQARVELKKVISLDLLPLANLRITPITPNETYSIVWKKDEHVLERFTNKTRVEIDDKVSVGNYSVRVQFWTEEVRVDSPVLKSEVNFEVASSCLGTR
ncbi:hypothetical protein CPC08DRAFT_735102 [Agrocybe pediades]|nr:hypothetical protein CPC08DRAFT_735102 [Agrocybe pediades]